MQYFKKKLNRTGNFLPNTFSHFAYYYYRYSAHGAVSADTTAQAGDWYSSGTLHPGKVLRGRLPLLSPAILDVPTFATRCPYVRHVVRDPSGGGRNCGRECCSGNFAEMTTSTAFRYLLHAANLRHGTDGFTSPPKKGV